MKSFLPFFTFAFVIHSIKSYNYRVDTALRSQQKSEFIRESVSSTDFIVYSTPFSNKECLPEQSELNSIRLFDTESGWGNGKHPTTRLCMKFIAEHVKPGCSFLDYGTGSGILSIMASKCGASRVLAVDVDDECIRAARDNIKLNNIRDNIQVIHTREVYVGDDRFQPSDITVANILPGPLTRLVAPLWYLTKPEGLLCLSGMRPDQLKAIQRIYEPYVDRKTERIEHDSHDLWGDWVSWSVRTKNLGDVEKKALFTKLTEESMME